MERSISREEILDYIYRTKHCFEDSKDENARKYFLHCIMAVYHLSLKCRVLREGDVDFYDGLFDKQDKLCDREKAIADICDWSE